MDAWIIVGSLAGVAGTVAVVVFGLLPYVRARRGRPSDSAVAAGAAGTSNPGPTHPLGVAINARSLRNDGVISADGPESFVNIVAGDMVNTGTVRTDQSGPGVPLADHLRVIAGDIVGAAAQWDRQSAESRGLFAALYVRYGYGRQASQLYDSAIKAGLHTAVSREVFECASSPNEACRVANQLVRWADELTPGAIDRRRRTGFLMRGRAQVRSRNARIRGQDTAFDVGEDARLDEDGSDIA